MSVRTVVFAGPTLPASARSLGPAGDIEWRPPAARGDLYREAQAGANVIGLIDGYFRSVPSTQHKEILWALDKGVVVIGAASMGALRAAELWQFGMIGIGKVFRDFATGRLSRDDEVAVEHGPAGLGYPATSEALINIRYSLAHAVAAQYISRETADSCISIAAQTFYGDRCLETTLRSYNLRHAPSQQISAVTISWLLANRKDQKAEDAMELIRNLRRMSTLPAHPHASRWRFEDTVYFSSSRQWMDNPFLRDCS